MRKKLLTSNDVLDAIDNWEDNKDYGVTCGLCTAFDPWRYGQRHVMDGDDVMRMIRATGGHILRGGDAGFFWTHPIERDPVAEAQRATYLAFLLAWVENP